MNMRTGLKTPSGRVVSMADRHGYLETCKPVVVVRFLEVFAPVLFKLCSLDQEKIAYHGRKVPLFLFAVDDQGMGRCYLRHVFPQGFIK